MKSDTTIEKAFSLGKNVPGFHTKRVTKAKKKKKKKKRKKERKKGEKKKSQFTQNQLLKIREIH